MKVIVAIDMNERIGKDIIGIYNGSYEKVQQLLVDSAGVDTWEVQVV